EARDIERKPGRKTGQEVLSPIRRQAEPEQETDRTSALGGQSDRFTRSAFCATMPGGSSAKK
ncbi:hypothetical protein ACP3WA_27090, partial [Salmonella enterica]|uniref:hypothetical protein n=1 Tax=Salmonella enterica TaxID=28901 RepID=UPI003CF5E67E